VMLYEDYNTTDPGVIERLCNSIQAVSYIRWTMSNSTSSTGITLPSSPTASTANSPNSSDESLEKPSRASDEPLCQNCSSSQCPYCPNRTLRKFLALCVNTGRYHRTVGEVDLGKANRDSEAFEMIRSCYLDTRGFRARARRFFLFQPKSAHFIKVRPLCTVHLQNNRAL